MPPPLPDAMTEDDVVDYLRRSPDFFQRHAELLAAVQLTSPHGDRAVSLQERQATLLREKIKRLEGRTQDMVRHGSENEVLTGKLLQWVRSLFLTLNPMDLPSQLTKGIETRFLVPQVALKVWGVSPAFAQAGFALGVEAGDQLFAASLTAPFCGVNAGFRVANWLDRPSEAKSLVILPLRAGLIGSTSPTFGLLVLASPEVQRFNNTLGTDFMARLAELASAALSPLTRE